MNLPAWVKISKPSTEQIKHDAFLVAVAFGGTFIAAWQSQPDPFSKAGVIAAWAAAVAAVVTVAKSILTTL